MPENFVNKSIINAIKGVFVLSIFLIVPTMWLKKNYILAIAKMPVWKKYEFFKIMFKFIKEDKKHTQEG